MKSTTRLPAIAAVLSCAIPIFAASPSNEARARRKGDDDAGPVELKGGRNVRMSTASRSVPCGTRGARPGTAGLSMIPSRWKADPS